MATLHAIPELHIGLLVHDKVKWHFNSVTDVSVSNGDIDIVTLNDDGTIKFYLATIEGSTSFVINSGHPFVTIINHDPKDITGDAIDD